jgi:hypothetical protein
LKDEADKIRRENQEILKKEKEAMRRQSLGLEDVESTSSTAEVIKAEPEVKKVPVVASPVTSGR